MHYNYGKTVFLFLLCMTVKLVVIVLQLTQITSEVLFIQFYMNWLHNTLNISDKYLFLYNSSTSFYTLVL